MMLHLREVHHEMMPYGTAVFSSVCFFRITGRASLATRIDGLPWMPLLMDHFLYEEEDSFSILEEIVENGEAQFPTSLFIDYSMNRVSIFCCSCPIRSCSHALPVGVDTQQAWAVP